MVENSVETSKEVPVCYLAPGPINSTPHEGVWRMFETYTCGRCCYQTKSWEQMAAHRETYKTREIRE